MFNLFKNKEQNLLYSPVVGTAIALDEVEDPMFSQKMLGDGIAFRFDTDTLYAPCDAHVVMIAATKHAIGLSMGNIEIMIHVGMNTVSLQGQGFNLLIQEGDQVKRGQAIMKLDRSFFDSNHVDLITPMIVTTKNVEVQHLSFGEVNLDSEVLKIL